VRFLADENFPGIAVTALHKARHDIRWVSKDDPGASDRIVMDRAAREERVILTFDKDFGELVFRIGGAAAAGVILFRFQSASPEDLVSRILRLLGSRTDWVGMFSVVDSNKLRMRPMRAEERNR
jgi:predicted nuclease of predicted toxin-antitoxin system